MRGLTGLGEVSDELAPHSLGHSSSGRAGRGCRSARRRGGDRPPRRRRSLRLAGRPDGVGIDGPPADHFVTSWGTGGFVTDGRGRRTRIQRQAVNLDENAIEVDVPWKQLGQLRGRSARLYLVSGLADPQGRQYLQPQVGQPSATTPGGGQPGSTAVFDAAFDAHETFTPLVSHWGEE